MQRLSYKGRKNVIAMPLRLMRVRKKVTQKELAARMQVLGVSIDQQAISNIENDNRIVTDYELACFAKALRCSEQDLLQDFRDKLRSED